MGKGDTRRPALISRELEELRWQYATQPMKFVDYERKLKALKRREKGR